MNVPCRCLLFEAGENELSKNVDEYVSGLSEDIKADSVLYQKRLEICKSCNSLQNGMCLKCGCYVEMRAAVKKNYCPHENKLW